MIGIHVRCLLIGNAFFEVFIVLLLFNQEMPIETQSLFFKGDLEDKAATINTLQN